MADIHDRIAELEAQLAELKAQVGMPNSNGSKPVKSSDASEAVNRRSMLRKTAAIAGAAAGGAILATAKPAGAIDGSNLVIGTVNTGSSPTDLRPTNPGDVPRILFLSNYRSGFVASQASFPAALAGWGSDDHYGVYAWAPEKPGLVASSGGSDVASLQLFARSAPPSGGTHAVGEFQALTNGALYVCSEAGTPGTWSNVGFTPLTPARFLDTRNAIGLSGKQAAGDANVRTLQIGGVTASGQRVPESARAIAANVTTVDSTTGGYVTLWNTGAPRPTASNVNLQPDTAIANFAIIPLGTGANAGKISIYNDAGEVNVLLDISGYFI